MASIPGHIKDEVVIIGCHRDGERVSISAWIFVDGFQRGSWGQQTPLVAQFL